MNVLALFTCFNRKEKTSTCIQSITSGNLGINFKFIVVDDGSSDGTVDMLKQLQLQGYSIEVLSGSGGLFYSGGMRMGMDHILRHVDTEYDYLLMMNDDVQFYEHSIEKLIHQCQKEQDAVIVGVTCNSDGQYSYGAIKYLKGLHYHGVGVEYSDMECDTFNANCVLIPEKSFKNSGGFDPTYVHCLGDFDFGMTLKRQGNKIYPSCEYVGVCNNNSRAGTWGDSSLPRSLRFKKKETPKGLPAKLWFYYVKKNFGWGLAIRASIAPYIKILIGK